jgi:hypothetical protein
MVLLRTQRVRWLYEVLAAVLPEAGFWHHAVYRLQRLQQCHR